MDKPGMDGATFVDAVNVTGRWIKNYRENCHKFPVLSQVKPGYLINLLPQQAPEDGESFDSIMHDIDKFIVPGMTHWASPNFFAYFKCHCSYESILADMVSAAFNCIGFTWISSPACTELEMITMNWMAKALHLPEKFLHVKGSLGGGVIQTTASESTLVSMLAAKARALQYHPERAGKLVAYVSDQAHFSLLKDFKVLEIELVRKIPVDSQFAMITEKFAEQLRQDVADGLFPFYLCTNFGTTSTTAIDPLDDLLHVVDEYSVSNPQTLWVHVDGAYGGAWCMLPEFVDKMKGFDRVDSIVINAHKAMLIGFDCSMFWVADQRWLYAALSLDPNLEPYLQNAASTSGNVIDFKNWQVPLGRRFRSLKLWFVMRSFGINGVKKHLSQSIENANFFASLLKENAEFEILPTEFSAVVFRYLGTNEENRELVELANSTGQMYFISTVCAGRVLLRIAVGGIDTDHENLVRAHRILVDSVKHLSIK